jgi:hypothetical protein
MNLSEFKIRIDLGFDGNEIVFAAEKVEERAKVSMHGQS